MSASIFCNGCEILIPYRTVVQHRVLILLGFVNVPLFVSSAVFLSVGPSLITVRFGSSEPLLIRGFSFRHNGGGGGRWKREKERKEAGKHA
jgi:hypothetical protein